MEFPKIDRANILIIDDDADIAAAIKQGLELPNIRLDISIAPNGLSGLQQAKTNRPDVIILDLKLPDINGFKVLDEIRKDPLLASTKVIMLTASDTVRNLWEGFDRQLDDFMVKPFDLIELEARIYNLLLAKQSDDEE